MTNPPELISTTRCDASLSFSPLTLWPQGLPAVSINKVLIAGFGQQLALNYQIPIENSASAIADLFRSLYSDLSFSELAALQKLSAPFVWLPIDLIVQKFGFQYNDSFIKVCQVLQSAPENFQKWCAEKKVGPQDLMPLLSYTDNTNSLNVLFIEIINLQLSKALGVKALELGIELLMMGTETEKLSSQNLFNANQNTQQNTQQNKDKNPGELWLESLTWLRYPETKARDEERRLQMNQLPWPGHSQARWVRQGDKAGIELKLFVTQPSDLKKYLNSLQTVQDLLEEIPKH